MEKGARRLISAVNYVDSMYLLLGHKGAISDNEYCFMYALDDEEVHSQAEISRIWYIPKTTVNAIVKKWEKEGLIIQRHIPGKRREMQLIPTEKGKAYIEKNLKNVYAAERTALEKTIKKYGDDFISALYDFADNLKEEFKKEEQEETIL